MTKIVWEAPPAQRRASAGRSYLTPLLTELRSRPGQWARLRSYSNNPNSVYPEKARQSRLHPDIEFVARMVDGEGVLYGRYVPSGTGS